MQCGGAPVGIVRAFRGAQDPRVPAKSEGEIRPPPMVALATFCDDSVMMKEKLEPVSVFLAEDSPLIRERVVTMLAAHDMHIVGQAQTPQDCIDGILSAHPDVVVLDVRLEGGTGLQVLRAVRRLEPDIGFVVFSNNADPAYRKRYLGEGARYFLDKSCEIDQLTAAIENSVSHLYCPPAWSVAPARSTQTINC